MRYMGSKRRIWKYIAPIILEGRKRNQLYVEPFCGGCNSLCEVEGRRLASDVNPYLIAMWKSLLNDEPQIYPISKEIYTELRKAYRNEDLSRYSKADMGWVGFMASFRGKFFDGYNGGERKTGGGKIRNYCDEAIANILAQVDRLRGVEFRCCNYYDLDIPRGSIVYLDPPYRDTEEYQTEDFDYEYFYWWAEELSKAGNKVFISEYWMPPFFREVWSMEIACNMSDNKSSRIEKLFTI